jgi:hypothetical protein
MISKPILRRISKAGSVVLLSLLPLSSGAAVRPSPGTAQPRTAPAHAAKATGLAKLVRQARSAAAPFARKHFRSFGIRRHPQPIRIQNGEDLRLSHDDEAIQNDTTAAESPGELLIALEPAGAFVEIVVLSPITRTLSPRAPRGPPDAA